MSQPPAFGTPEWNALVREARAEHNSLTREPRRGSRGGSRGGNRGSNHGASRGTSRGASRGASIRASRGDYERGGDSRALFSPSVYTPRTGISSDFPGSGGFSIGGISSTSLFSNNAQASTTQGVALNNEPRSLPGQNEFGGQNSMTPSSGGPSRNFQAPVEFSSIVNPAVHQTSTASALQSITNQPSQPKRSTSEEDGHESSKRARNGDSPFESAVIAQGSYSSAARTSLNIRTAASGILSVATAAPRPEGPSRSHGGLGNSRFSSANSQTPTIHQPVHSAAPAASFFGSPETATAGSPQQVHASNISETSDVEMHGVDEAPLRSHGGLGQSRFAGAARVPAEVVHVDREVSK
jgi:hypothetical protein